MNKSIHYPRDKSLGHYDSTKRIKSFLWKIMYKRLKNKVNTDLINPINLKKIIFNKYFVDGLTYNSPLPQVSFHKTASWYLEDDNKEYYIPLSLSFTNGKIRFDLVLIDGEIDFRNVETKDSKGISSHKPMLLLKNLEILELCFELLLEHIEKYEKENN